MKIRHTVTYVGKSNDGENYYHLHRIFHSEKGITRRFVAQGKLGFINRMFKILRKGEIG